jgi:hypothetical protein
MDQRGTMSSNLERRSMSELLGATPAGGWRSNRWRNRPTAVAHWSKPLSALRSTKLSKVFTYDIVAMWRNYIAHLGRTSGNNGGWCGRGGSVQARHRWRQAPGLLRLNRGHQRGRRSSVILPGRLIWHGRWHTSTTVS